MNLACCICSDLFVPSDDVFSTPCGHLFHFACVTQWLERSASCPQCRAKVTQNKISRLYFNLYNSDSIKADPASLQQQIDSLEFKVTLQRKEIEKCEESIATYKKQTTGLREEVKKLELKITKLKSAEFALKDQVTFFREQAAASDAARNEVIRLRKKLEDCQNVQKLMDYAADDVDDMIANVKDTNTLITYISVMKREIERNVGLRRELRNRMKAVQQELTKVSMERNYLLDENEKRKQLEEDLEHSQRDIKSLQAKVRELQKVRASGSSKRDDSELERFIAESPAPKRYKNSEGFNATSNSLSMEDGITKDDSVIVLKPEEIGETTGDENDPILTLKPRKLTDSKQGTMNSKSSNSSILLKKPRLTQSSQSNVEFQEIAYDGFGGHSKADIFPRKSTGFKTKKTKDNVMIMKLKRPKMKADGTRKLDSFFVDLT